MTTSALNRLTVIGSCLLLGGFLGGLLLYAIPVMTGHGWQIILYWILPATLTGAALIGFQAWQTPSDALS